MELSQIIPHIEALVFASDKPLTSLDIVDLINNAFGFMEERITLDQIEAALLGIQEKYNAEFYPFTVKVSGGGYQFLTKKEFHQTVGQLNGDKFLKRLSNAALETLAIIAYKQPITKGEVEAIRGVNSDYSVQKLLEKELIIITGRNEELPGKPLVYATSKSFMDYFGINSTDDLPKIREVLAEQSIQGTLINDAINAHGHSDEEENDNTILAVADDGSLVVHPVNAEERSESETDIPETKEDKISRENIESDNNSVEEINAESVENIESDNEQSQLPSEDKDSSDQPRNDINNDSEIDDEGDKDLDQKPL